METTELIDLLSRGEDSRQQFKTDMNNADALAAEIVAFSNTAGGRIFIGVNDDGSVRGLSGTDVARLNMLIANVASQVVRPAVNPLTENVPHPNGIVMVVTIAEGVSKPYMDKNGTIWVKNGADKRRATSREELQRLFQQAGLVHADETPVAGLGAGDVDMPYFETFFEQQFGEPLAQHHQPLPQLLSNMNLMNQGQLNVAGSLLFAKTPQYTLPAFIVKAVAFVGTQIENATSTAATSPASWPTCSSRRWGSLLPTPAPSKANRGLTPRASPKFHASSGKSWSPTPSFTATTSSARRSVYWCLRIGSKSSAPATYLTT
nr:RNA-binding domain-containing protein [Cephaloticoccus primus]